MRRTKLLIALGMFTALFTGCEQDDSMDNMASGTQLMVEAYVFSGEPVDHVKIAKVHSEGAAQMIPVQNASVTISQGAKSAQLELKDAERGIYQIADSELIFSGSEALNLEIVYGEKTYSATTFFPTEISELSISNEEIQVTAADNSNPLTTLSWMDNSTDRAYCIFSRGIPLDSAMVHALQTSHESPLYNLNYETTVDLYSDHFTHLGDYQLYVSAVNEEYIEMYYENTTPELRGAPTNIDGAWGVFTAFNGLSVDVSVE